MDMARKTISSIQNNMIVGIRADSMLSTQTRSNKGFHRTGHGTDMTATAWHILKSYFAEHVLQFKC